MNALARPCLAVVLSILSACDPAEPPGTVESTETRASFAFGLVQWRCRHATARTAEKVITADGEFCYAEVNVRNRGASGGTLEASCQFLIDGEDRYAPDPEVMALDALAAAGFGTEIGPGELVENSALYYDVPVGSRPDALELHEECGGPGELLPLTRALRAD